MASWGYSSQRLVLGRLNLSLIDIGDVSELISKSKRKMRRVIRHSRPA